MALEGTSRAESSVAALPQGLEADYGAFRAPLIDIAAERARFDHASTGSKNGVAAVDSTLGFVEAGRKLDGQAGSDSIASSSRCSSTAPSSCEQYLRLSRRLLDRPSPVP